MANTEDDDKIIKGGIGGNNGGDGSGASGGGAGGSVSLSDLSTITLDSGHLLSIEGDDRWTILPYGTVSSVPIVSSEQHKMEREELHAKHPSLADAWNQYITIQRLLGIEHD